MTTPSQRQVFLDGEGDAWFHRNYQSDADQIEESSLSDPLVGLLENLPFPRGTNICIRSWMWPRSSPG